MTAATPAVDVRSAGAATTLPADIVKALPTVRSYNALVVLIPGVVTTTNDVVTGTTTTQFPIHGGRSNEGRLTLDGIIVGGPAVGNSPTSYVVDAGATEEVTFASAGGLGENETGGLVVNLVPKTGGNSTHGSLFFSGTGEKLQSDNLTPALKKPGRHRGEPAQQGLRRLRHDRRTDRQGSLVVFRHRAPWREHDGKHERLLQPQRRGPGEVVVCARFEPESVLGPPVRERQRACHVADDPAQQGQRLLG